MMELRWKSKTRNIKVPVHPENFGSPMINKVDQYRVLEFRQEVVPMKRDDPGITWSDWEEVPHVGLNTEINMEQPR